MATPPTFVSPDHETVWGTNATPKTLSAFTPGNGNILVALAAEESNIGGGSVSGGPTWTQQQRLSTGSQCQVWGFTATGAGSSITPAISDAGITTQHFGGDILEFSGSAGIGSTDAVQNLTGTHVTRAFTTAFDNSALAVIWADFNARAITGRTYDSVNSAQPVEVAAYDGITLADYSVLVVYYADAGAAGSKTVGVTLGTSMTASVVIIEIKGTAGVAPIPRLTMAPMTGV